MVNKSKLLLRLQAAAWAAAVALIPVMLFVRLRPWQWYFTGDEFYLQLPGVIAAVVAAAISGSLFGWRLVNAGESHDWRSAVVIGLKVTFWAHCLLAVAPAPVGLLILPAWLAQEGITWEQLLEEFLKAVLVFPIFVVFISLMFIGWATIPIGIVAGYLLSKHYRKGQASVPVAEN
jgi:hypothetical protein